MTIYKILDKISINPNVYVAKGKGNPLENYNLINKLGDGNYGEFWKAQQKDTGYICALKKIKKKETVTLEEENEIINDQIKVIRRS